ncbi:Protein-glutamate methylesterase/protein-glutamine glutaminase (plasmid) [Asticcacaulis sp. MM231]|uniref:response regulator n=1 Tax=Asticcacaulis sp. MM231 TaxID=3157666 RepID=UPI0032D582A8
MPVSDPAPTVLAIDDEAFNLDILGEYLEEDGYIVSLAVDGRDALDKLAEIGPVDVIVLDRMMPRMDGMECLRHLKADPRFCDIPVIMQTAAASHEQIRQGIDGGVFYYLTKPYESDVLLSLVRAAMAEARLKSSLRLEVRQNRQVLGLMEKGEFHFSTLKEAQTLAVFLANCFPEPERVVYGLSELMVNAVEHGNLGISYSEKKRLIIEGRWKAEVEHRLTLPQYAHRRAHLNYDATPDYVSISISDEGEGFDFASYLELSPERATDPNGRGIATARLLSFDSLEYSRGGNTVTCSVNTARRAI